jgi:SAM-dependent methyltransferase
MVESVLVTAAEVARLAGVGRAAVSNWRRRHDDFPQPAGGTEASPMFRLVDVQNWLRAEGKLGSASGIELVWHELDAQRGTSVALALAAAGTRLAERQEPPSGGALGELVAELGGEAVFQRLLSRFVEAHSRQLAVTSPELAGLIVELAEVRTGLVLDPACGTGSLLCAAPPGVELRGQEIDPDLAALARARLRFRAAPSEVHTGDALRADAFSGVPADAVVCNPPFNQRNWGFEELQYDRRWVYGLPPKGESEMAWVQHCLAHLRPGGRAVLVMPPAVASRRSGRAIRAELLRHGALRTVIALPAGAVPPAGLSMHLWVLQRPGVEPNTDGVLLLDTTAGRPDRINDVGWPLVAQRVRTARTQPHVDGVHRVLAVIDLLDDDVDLTPSRYLRPATDLSGLDADRDRLAELVADLLGLIPPPARPVDRTTWAAVSLADLARAGDLLVRQQRRPAEAHPDGTGPVVLTVQDVVGGQAPTGRLLGDADLAADTVRLEPGDVVAPLIAQRPVAVVVEQSGLVLGANLHLLRPDPARIDPWFLAGYLRSGEAARVSSSASGLHRLDVRRVEVPRLPIEEQRRIGAGFRRVATFARALTEAAALGGLVAERWTDGVAEGLLDPGGTVPPATE